MEKSTREAIIIFVRPLYQDLDGSSHFDEVERVSTIARRLLQPAGPEEQHFELLLLFQGLGRWLSKMGNRSRTTLSLRGHVSGEELESVVQSLSRLDAPTTPDERALGAARLIDRSGLHGLLDRLGRARREGSSVEEIAREAAAVGEDFPDWLPEEARSWMRARLERKRLFCEALLKEKALED